MSSKSISIFKSIACVVVLSLILTIMTPFIPEGAKITTFANTDISRKNGFKVLMIGNSLTKDSGNTTSRHLQNLCANSGITLRMEILAYGGECLETYANANTYRGQLARRMIRKKDWDVIVLQQETKHAIARGSSLTQAVRTISNYAAKNCPSARIVLNCTWAYDKTVTAYGHRYTHRDQQINMDRNYRNTGRATGAAVVYSGDAFDLYRNTVSRPVALYASDKNHATHAGWFLNACCLYNVLFRRPVTRADYYGGQSAHTAKMMKIMAKRVEK